MSRKSFPKESKNKTRPILDLVHTDVCSPMQTMTPSQKRYVLTIIDDFSRFSKVYPVQHKSETTKTQFNRKPKIIRSDRGKEYVNEELRIFT